MSDRRNVPSDRRAERGSAFVVALLVLLVLTIAGLALTLLTQTEMRIGANEREANRTLYAADSGIEVSTARTLWAKNDRTLQIVLNTTQQDTNSGSAPPLTFGDQIVVTPLHTADTQKMGVTSLNQNQPTQYVVTTSLVNSSTTRTGQLGAVNQAMAQKVLGAMIALQPRDEASAIDYNTTGAAALKH